MKPYHSHSPRTGAFTLLEVMIATALFFMGIFAVLALVSQSLKNARALQRPMVDAGVLASQLALTNQLVEGVYTVDLDTLLGPDYKNYKGTINIEEASTNRLFRADMVVQNASGAIISQFSTLYYMPKSPAGSMDGATAR